MKALLLLEMRGFFLTGYGGRKGLVYIGEKLVAGVKISLLGVS
jgi:hypothetical protein